MKERALSPRELYLKWVNSKSLSSIEKQKLKMLTPKEQVQMFTIDGSEFQFGTSGIRALTGLGPKQINIHTCKVFAVAYALFLMNEPGADPVIIGYDNRENGAIFAKTIYQVLRQHSINALISSESIATPVLAFYIKYRNLKGGVMITASHNPMNYNGFKVYGPNGGQLSMEQEFKIRNYFPEPKDYLAVKYSSETFFETVGNEVFDLYTLSLTREIKRRLGLFYFLGSTIMRTIKFLFSSHHGTSSGRMASLSRNFGAQKFKEFYWECTPTSNFSEEEITNPEEPRSFKSMAREARNLNIDYLIAHDPDSDRSALAEWVGDKWYHFTGNEIAVLLAHFLLELSQNPRFSSQIQYKYLVTTYVSGDFIDKVVKLFQPDFQIEIIRTDTGFKSIGQKVDEYSQRGEVLLGCEEAIGGLFLPEISLEKDGFQQTILTMYMIGFCKFGASKEPLETNERKLISQLYWLMWKTGWAWLGKTVSFKINEKEKENILRKLNWLASQEKRVQLERFQFKTTKGESEGIFKFTFFGCSESWIKTRFSGTEPKFKLYFNLYSNISEFKKQETKNWESIVRERRARLNYTIQLLTKLLETYLFHEELIDIEI
ncbi:phosphoglucomutase [Mycoplasma ovis str. Michigan]|uniref:Phosphoglucomutase n=1 Tax=Mycoplasma ovis str. Michigan TaxID=1415773 RepID=A0ABM5P0Z9_9MOLU|nr:phosphoglucomutase [Mycoplasma ovis]AHC40052.1 phosphoglucomutase [Mycoplasma ovis str. Michigan]